MIRSFFRAGVALVITSGCRSERAPEAAPSVAISAAPIEPARAPSSAPAAAMAPVPRGIGKRITEIRVVDDARFWMVADGRAWETRDGGRSFTDRTPFARPAGAEPEWHEVWSLLASPPRIFILRGDVELATWMTLFVSEDGGSSFVERRVPRLRGGREARMQAGPGPGSLLVLRSDGGGMNSHATNILETRDAGLTFRELGTVTGYGALSFQTPTTWWTVGTCCAEASSVYRSTDAGHTWKPIAAPTDTWEPISDLVFLDAAHGYRVARAGEQVILERTDDGGRSFARANPPLAADAVLAAEPDACVLLGERGPVVTRDRGASWTSLAPFPAGLSASRLARTPSGWLAIADAGSTASALLVLRDGGAAWEALSPAWR